MFSYSTNVSKDFLNLIPEITAMVEPLIVAKFIVALDREPVFLLEYKVELLKSFLKTNISNFDSNQPVNDVLNLFNIFLLKEYPFWNTNFLMQHGFVDLVEEILQYRFLAVKLIIEHLSIIDEFSNNDYIRINFFSIIINGVIF